MRTVVITVAATAALALPALAQGDFDAVEIAAQDLGEGLFLLTGAGGNIGVSIGPDGVFMIDDQFAPLTDKIEAKIGELTGEAGKARFIVNTHFHFDHVGGNELWAADGTTIVAHDNVRARLITPVEATFSGETPEPSPAGAWPILTFAQGVTFHLNGETVKVDHVPNGHTDGDAIVRFVERDLIHMGDLFFNGLFPYIDTNAGGSVAGYIAGQDAVLATADDDTRIIPGHGPLATKTDLQTMRDVLAGVRDAVQARIDAGDTLEQAIAAKPLAAWDQAYGQAFIKTDQMVEIVYNDLTRAASSEGSKPDDHGHNHEPSGGERQD